MTQESELDRLIGPSHFTIRQMHWRILSAFESLQLLEGRRPVMREAEMPVSPERRKRFKINVSDLEKIIPYVAYNEGLIDELQPMQRGPRNEEALIYGKLLHQADILFNLVSQGHTGKAAHFGLPTYTPQELEPFQRATDGIILDGDAQMTDIREANFSAWERFFNPPESSYNLTLDGFGVSDERKVSVVRVSKEAYELGRRFALFWAQQVSDRRNRMWEFRRNYLTEREVGLTAIPQDINLIISTNFDFISRVSPSSDMVTTHIGDLKTGRIWDKDDLYGEILKIQAQLMLLLAEKYTVDGLGGKQNLEMRGKYYVLKQSAINNTKTVGRSLFVYRVIPRDTLVMERVAILTDRPSREVFVSFLDWLVDKMYKYEGEVRSLINGNKEFKLAGVRMKEPFPV